MVLAAGTPETGPLLLELGLIIVVLSALGHVAWRAGLSPIPLYLLAGLAFGEGGLLPLDASVDFVEPAAEIGIILLLLLLGLEYSAAELSTSLRRNAPAGVLDMALNATPGAVAGLLLGLSPVGVVALAGVTWVSSSGIVAKVVTDLGRLGNRETPVVLSVLVFEDLAMAVYLPLLVAALAGLSFVSASVSVAVALVVVVAVLFVAFRYGEHLSSYVFSADDEQMLLRVLGLTLVVAGVAQQLQVSAAVGAFLVGIGLSGRAAESARGLLSPLRDLFAAVFFVTVGLRTDPSAIPPVLVPALLLALVTLVTKLVTGWWAAGRAGVGPPGRIRAGGALVARGEFSVVVAGLAVAADVDGIGSVATAYVLLMAVVGPLVARYGEVWAAPLLRRVRARERREVEAV
jgi:monovalent cation:H+ antiporter-2, CPA2 family